MERRGGYKRVRVTYNGRLAGCRENTSMKITSAKAFTLDSTSSVRALRVIFGYPRRRHPHL